MNNTNNTPVLACSGLGKTFTQGSYSVPVLNNIDFAIYRGVTSVFELEPVGGGLADGRERLVDQIRHGEYGRSGVEAIAVDVEAADPSSRMRSALHHDDLAAASGEVQRRRQAG